MQFLFTVDETFEMGGRGLVLAPGVGPDVRCQMGEEIELRRPDGTCLTTRIAGIELLDPNPTGLSALLLPPGIGKAEVPAGTEVRRASSA